jgi:hypothetical protein
VPLQISLLGWAERLIKEHFDSAVHQGQSFDLVGFATAHKQGWIRGFAFAGQPGYGFQPPRFGQQTQLL